MIFFLLYKTNYELYSKSRQRNPLFRWSFGQWLWHRGRFLLVARKACADWWAGKLWTLPANESGKVKKTCFLDMFFFFFHLFVSRVLITLYSLTLKTGPDDIMCVLFRPKKEKEKKDRIYNQNFNVKFKLLVSFFSFWARLVKTCNKKGEAEMHWTVGQLIGLLQHPLVSDCIPLYPGLILNYFKPLKLYLIVNNNMLGLAPLLSVAFTETCPVYQLFTVTLWSMNLHYKFLI